MEQARIATERRKPTLVLTKNHAVSKNMELGDRGNLDVTLQVEGESLEMDDTMNEFKNTRFILLKAEKILDKGLRG